LRLKSFQPEEEYVYLTYSIRSDRKEESKITPLRGRRGVNGLSRDSGDAKGLRIDIKYYEIL
jgi:hypothetical protein